MLLEEMRRTIERYGMIERGDRVVVAVSGGADSMVLLYALHALREDLACDLVVAHLDHGLRPSSGDDARFVAEAAAALGLPIVCERQDVAALAYVRHRGIEEAAREARRAFLSRVTDERQASRIALGHTADDQAETVLFRLARGTGWNGLCGMAPVSGRVIRPLLPARRGDVRRFAVERGIVWREDATNTDLHFARNRIRERVLPELAAVNPDVVRAVTRSADLARDARDVERYVVDRLWPDVCQSEGLDSVRMSRAALAGLPRAVQSVALREAMRRARGDLQGVARAHVEAVRRLMTGERECGELHLPRLRIVASPSTIEFAAWSRRVARDAWLVPLSLGRTTVEEPGVVVELSLLSRDEVSGVVGPWSEVADADSVRFPLIARGRRAGDRFAPLGMGKDVRLKSFLINARVPLERRDRLLLVCDQEKVVWVAGVRLSDAVRLRESTRRVLVMRAEGVDR